MTDSMCLVGVLMIGIETFIYGINLHSYIYCFSFANILQAMTTCNASTNSDQVGYQAILPYYQLPKAVG